MKHGLYGTPTYISWASMIQRCTNPRHVAYDRYRNVHIVKRWRDFRNFLADMGKRPKGKMLDRIDPRGNYTPSNCRWATKSLSARNISHGTKLTKEQAAQIRKLLLRFKQADVMRRFGISRSHVCNIAHGVRWAS